MKQLDAYSREPSIEEKQEIEKKIYESVYNTKDLLTIYSELSDTNKKTVDEEMNKYISTYKDFYNSEEYRERLDFNNYLKYGYIFALFSKLRYIYAKDIYKSKYSMYKLNGKTISELEEAILETLSHLKRYYDLSNSDTINDIGLLIHLSIYYVNTNKEKYNNVEELIRRMNVLNYIRGGSINKKKKIYVIKKIKNISIK